MLRTLVLQLSCQLRDNHRLLSRLHDSYRDATPPDPALMDCLHQLVRAFEDVYIILDALDESPRDKHRADALQALADLREWSEPRLHLLVTSRDEPDIRDELEVPPDLIISMKNASVDSDIAAFVAGHLRKNRRLRRWQDHYSRIEAVLVDRARGVFRWVECQFKALESCPECEDLLDRLLESLPQSLDETYERMLSNISTTSADYARRVLTLLCCATRPLTVAELIDGIAVQLGDSPKFNRKRRLQNGNAIHQVCPGFIEIDTEPEIDRTTVRIAHFSVQEYLESERVRQHSTALFSVRRPEAHAELACICLTYLLEPALSASSNPGTEYPLAAYAATSWHEHYHHGDKSLYQIELQALQLFQGASFLTWVQIQRVEGWYWRGSRREVPSPLYFASLLGLGSVTAVLLCEEPPDRSGHGPILSNLSDWINARGGRYGSALLAACAGGHEAVVRLLLATGAGIEGGRYGTALQAASVGGHEAVVQLLLEKGADVNTEGGRYGNALQAASYGGHQAVVRLLLGKGANVDAQGGEYGTALQAASGGGQRHEAVVRLLLEMGANVNTEGGHYGDALQAASAGGLEAVVRLLLDKGASINAEGGFYGNALQAASARGHKAVVRLLLEMGVDVNSEGGEYGTALQAASVGGHEAVVRLLLATGADIEGGRYGNALQAASYGGHQAVVRLLLGKGANVDAQGGEYGTALQAASGGGQRHEAVVRLLLEMGANVNTEGGHYGDALQAASAGGHEAVVRLLLDKGAQQVHPQALVTLRARPSGGVLS